jgi:exopolysaccharide biosynthesis polyprenyl glycosylphosphotransferase
VTSLQDGAAVPTVRRAPRLRRVDVPVAKPVRITTTWATTYVHLLFGLDIVAGIVAAVAAFVSRFGLQRQDPYTSHRHVLLAILVPVIWVGSAALCRAYEERFAGSGSEDVKRMANAAIRSLAGIALISYAFQLDFARGLVFPALIIAALLSLGGRVILRTVLSVMRERQRWVNRVVVVGTPEAVRRLNQEIARRPDSGHVVSGACTVGAPDDALLHRHQIRVLGHGQDVLAALHETGADTVAVAACPEMDSVALRHLAWQLEGTGVDLLVAPLLTDVAGSRIHVRPVNGLPLLHVEEPELSGGRHLTKALFDRTAAALGLLLLMPLLVPVAIAIVLNSRGGVFFTQSRVGKNGRLFTIYKFRSMCAGADKQVIDLSDENVHANGPLFKIVNDPRVTKVGAFIRRYSIDELPQLLNVVLGHMSLVGPRPPLPTEVEQYEHDVHRRLLVKPGLTGLWQVSGRSDLAWDESVRLDLHYVENWSLAQDVAILFKTVHAVLGRSGAY